MVRMYAAALVCLLVSFTGAGPSKTLSHSLDHGHASTSTSLPPSQDPFYTRPSHFEKANPGDLLRIRQTPGDISKFVPNCKAAYHVVFRTTDARSRPSWAVTTLFVPKKTTGKALLSYQIPYNSPDVDQSPSYTVLQSPNVFPDIGDLLGDGWFVNVPDHEGVNAAFGATVGDGFATLDSVRVVLKKGFGLHRDARYAMWGYSGGSIASELATELQGVYAPELNFSGVALGGLPSNLTAVFDTVNESYFAALIGRALMGFGNEYPKIEALLQQKLKTDGPYNRTGFLAGRTLPIDEAFPRYANEDIWKYFEGGRDILDQPYVNKVFRDNGYMGYHGKPNFPMFVYKAVHDDVTPIQSTDDLIDWYCKDSATILYERNTIGTHLDEIVNGRPRALKWLSAALNGEEPDTGSCTIRDVTVNATATQ